MDIIIDANIFRRDLKLKDKNFEVIMDYLQRTNSRLMFPLIVLEEIKGLYKRVLLEKYEEFKKSEQKLNSTLLYLEMPKIPELNIEEDSNKYIDYLHEKFKTNTNNIIPYKNEYLHDLVRRAIERKKPLDGKGQQFRDGILWLTILDYAESKKEKVISFISDNPSDFSDKGDNNLSMELVNEAKSRGVDIKYFRTLNDFVKLHASTIAFITEKWINDNLNFKILESFFFGILDEKFEDGILDGLDLDSNERATGHIHKTDGIISKVMDYYVYEKKDGVILLTIDIQFEVEYEIEVERTIEKNSYRHEFITKVNPVTGDQEMDHDYIPYYSVENEYDFKFHNQFFTGKFVITIIDKSVKDYQFKDWDWG